MDNKVVVEMLFGSHLYGLNTETSDVDYKGIVLPTYKEIIMQQAKFHMNQSTGDDYSKNSADDIDREWFSIMRFIELAVKGETVAIDMLHAPRSAIIRSTSQWRWLQDQRHKFYTKNMKAYIGYVRKQAAKYGVKGSRLAALEEARKVGEDYMHETRANTVGDILAHLPYGEYSELVTTEHPAIGEQTFYEICGRKFQSTLKLMQFLKDMDRIIAGYGERAKAARDNQGIDWKAVSHALRAGYQAKGIYLDGDFTYPLPQTKFLAKVKCGSLNYLTQVQPVLEDLVDEVMELAEASDYPAKVDTNLTNKLLLNIHGEIIDTHNS